LSPLGGRGVTPPPPPRLRVPQMTFWALRAGVFTGGGGLMNQLKKVAIDIGPKCLSGNASGFDANSRSAVALYWLASVLAGGEGKCHLSKKYPHLALLEGVVL
jgi:hypothetical protein